MLLLRGALELALSRTLWYPKPQINRRMKMLINRLVYNYRTNRKFMPIFRALRWAWINSTRGA